MENRLAVARERERKWNGLGIWVNRCKLLHLEWISSEVLLCSTGNHMQSLGIAHDTMMEDNIRKGIYICVCVCVCVCVLGGVCIHVWVTFLYRRTQLYEHNIVNQLFFN